MDVSYPHGAHPLLGQIAACQKFCRSLLDPSSRAANHEREGSEEKEHYGSLIGEVAWGFRRGRLRILGEKYSRENRGKAPV